MCIGRPRGASNQVCLRAATQQRVAHRQREPAEPVRHALFGSALAVAGLAAVAVVAVVAALAPQPLAADPLANGVGQRHYGGAEPALEDTTAAKRRVPAHRSRHRGEERLEIGQQGEPSLVSARGPRVAHDL